MTEKPRTALRLESLETRDLLAPLLGVTVNLYEDAGGVPGAPIASDAVEVGQEFFVEVAVEDVRWNPRGVEGLYLDIQWDPDVLEEVDTFAPCDPDNPVVTPDFPAFRSGRLDNAGGTIDELGGLRLSAFGVGRTLGVGEPERFALLKFKAEAPTQGMPLDVSIGRGGIGMLYRGPLRWSDVQIEKQTITVGQTSQDAVDAVMGSEDHLADAVSSLPQSLQRLPAWAQRRAALNRWW